MNVKAAAYWTATTIIGLETLADGVTDLTQGRTMLALGPRVVEVIKRLGYPKCFLKILGTWKVLGGIALFVPGRWRLKEWAHAGIFFELTGAAASSTLNVDDVSESIAPLSLAALAVISWALALKAH